MTRDMRGSLIFTRQEGSTLFLCLGREHECEAIPITPEKALDLAVELLTLSRPIIMGRLYGNSEQASLRDGNGGTVLGDGGLCRGPAGGSLRDDTG